MTFEIQRDRMTIIHVCPNGCDFEYLTTYFRKYPT